VKQRQLMLYAVFALAQRVDPTPDRCHALTLLHSYKPR